MIKIKRFIYILCGAMLIASIFSPFIIGNKPIFIKYNGKIYLPIFKNYSYKDFNSYSNLAAVFNKNFNNELYKKKAFIIYPVFKTNFSYISKSLQKPSSTNILGTNILGEDVFFILLSSLKYIFSLVIIIGVLGSFMGLILGIFLGFSSKAIDFSTQRLYEIWLSVPISYIFIVNSSINFSPIFIMLGILFLCTINALPYGRYLGIQNKDNQLLYSLKLQGSSNFFIIYKGIFLNNIDVFFNIIVLNSGFILYSLSLISIFGNSKASVFFSLGDLINQGLFYGDSYYYWLVFPPIIVYIFIFSVIFMLEKGFKSGYFKSRKFKH